MTITYIRRLSSVAYGRNLDPPAEYSMSKTTTAWPTSTTSIGKSQFSSMTSKTDGEFGAYTTHSRIHSTITAWFKVAISIIDSDVSISIYRVGIDRYLKIRSLENLQIIQILYKLLEK